MSGNVQKDYNALLFGVQRSVRYHDRREGFFRWCHTFVMFSAVVFGSATAVTFGAEIGESLPLWVRLLPAMLMTLFSAVDLVVRVSDKAHLHAGLRRQFIDLERQLIVRRREAPLDDLVSEITDKRLQIEATEPPVLKVLDTLCHNELMRANGHERKDEVPVNWLQRLCAQFFDVAEASLYSTKH